MVHSILNLPNLTDIFVVNDYIVIVRSRTYNGANEIFTLYIESVTRHNTTNMIILMLLLTTTRGWKPSILKRCNFKLEIR